MHVGIKKNSTGYSWTEPKLFDVKPLKDFRKVVGDALAGHELLQAGWLRAHGLLRFQKLNPAVALDSLRHGIVNAAQYLGELHVPAKLASMSRVANIRHNLNILRALDIVPEQTLLELHKAAIRFARTLR